VKEQVIAQKVGNRSGIASNRGSSGTVQRPARRGRPGDTLGARVRAMLDYLPAVLKLVLAIVAGLLTFTGYRAAASASFFQIRSVEVQGASRASAEEVQTLVRREVSKTGVWNADLAELSAKLQRLSWVRNAIVSRVLPDGVRVRISERVPRAVVRTSSGHFRWVDDDAVLLGEMVPTDQLPPFFLRGLAEEESEGARKENVLRVRKFLELQREWEAIGLSDRISEVNLIDTLDVRAQLAGDDSQIEVRLGSQDPGKRLKQALEVLDGQRQTARGPFISYVDLSQGKRAIIGFVSGAYAIRSQEEASTRSPGSEKANKRDAAGNSDKEKQRALNNASREEKARKDRNNKGRPEKRKEDSNRRTE
jgi:cell division protein FtsQ